MQNYRFRIFISLLIAFAVVYIYRRISYTPFISPIQAENIKRLLSNIKFPTVNLKRLFTLHLNPQLSNNQSPITNNQTQFTLSAAPQKSTNSNFNYFQPTLAPSNEPSPTPGVGGGLPQQSTPTIFITKLINITPTNKPTKPPKATATPKPVPITSDLRPGSSLGEIFKEVNKRACFPTALLWAFKTLETGERFKNDNPSIIKTYNTYGWWITGAGDPCYGYGYYTQTGIIPQDSVKAGQSCSKPIGNPNDIKIMGIFQISEYEQQVAQKYISSQLPKNDRRVLFDNALIFAYITKSRVPGGAPKDCDSWPDNTIMLVAEKHHGVCNYDYGNGTAGNYCKQILDLYKKYK